MMLKQYLFRRNAAVRGQAAEKVVRVTAISSVVAVAGLSLGFAPSFSITKDMGDATARPNPLANARLFVDPASNARRQADSWRSSRPDQARALDIIAQQPQAFWINEWAGNPKSAVRSIVTKVGKANALPVLVAYNIPNRDCGSHSAGGAKDGKAYQRWIRDFAAGLSGRKSVVVLEPDALAGKCADGERTQLMRDAVQVLKSAGAAVYIDAGNPNWIAADVMGRRLNEAGIAQADGFALNVSNFYRNAENIAYGEKVSRVVGGKHFIIDTSRNGNGSANGAWCNPGGRALGSAPTAETGHRLVDAYLWIKRPGESDGRCGGGPNAGKWWGQYALELAQRQPAALAVNN
ncbi:MAG TPA: glycoside hydrolase family 6 protein [Longimicrobiales bacterium]